MVEQLTVNQLVAGSSPACGAINIMIYRRKNHKKRTTEVKSNSAKHYDKQPSFKQAKNPKQQRLSQIENEIQELVHSRDAGARDRIDQLMLERIQIRHQLGL